MWKRKTPRMRGVFLFKFFNNASDRVSKPNHGACVPNDPEPTWHPDEELLPNGHLQKHNVHDLRAILHLPIHALGLAAQDVRKQGVPA